jgi:hypothetical protein
MRSKSTMLQLLFVVVAAALVGVERRRESPRVTIERERKENLGDVPEERTRAGVTRGRCVRVVIPAAAGV